MILLVSATDSLIEAVSAALPASIPFIHLPTVAEAEPYLDSSVGDKLEATLILVDTQEGQQVVAHCRQLCQENGAGDVPIIAIIVRPDHRQVVLEAGATDYLLLPLLPAEIQTRLVNYTRSSSYYGFDIWIDAFHNMSKGVSPSQVLNQSLENLARTFDAPSAWLYSFNPQNEINLVSSYKLPPLFQQDNIILNTEARTCQKLLKQDGSTKAKIIPSPNLLKADYQLTKGLTHYLSIPLNSHQQLTGILNLAYPEPPQFSHIERQALVGLGQDIGILLEICQLQEEAQVYATQNAFMVLLAHRIGEQLDLNTVLSLSLEQTVPFLNASGGDIWLLSSDGQWLELALSLSSARSGKRALMRQVNGQGLIGWVAERSQVLCVNENLTDDPRYDPKTDQITGISTYSLLAAPLHHREKIIGVIAIHNEHGAPFANPDRILLEGIASLTASAITNARLMQELQDYAGQQRALYEMSQQIAAGLDLQVTLNRVLQWINHLCEVEFGLLWLVEEAETKNDDSTDTLRLVAGLNTGLLWEQQIVISARQGLVGWAVRTGQATMVNDPANDSRYDPSIVNLFGAVAHNVLAVPMIHHDQIIGAISMFNKIGGPFEEVDLILLSTAIEMIAVAVGNAKLHTQTVTLMKEQEHLHKQILQRERLATVGRLTASLSHEINNPMQTIQFALRLAKEKLDNRQKLTTYIDMSMKESDRVVQLVNRMSQIYRPQSDIPEVLDVNRLLQEVIAIARKELRRRDVSLEAHLASELPPLTAIANQLYLVCLSLILNLGDAIAASGGGQLQLRSYALPYAVHIEFTTNVSLTSTLKQAIFEWKASQSQQSARLVQGEASFNLSLSQDIIVAHGGIMELNQQNGQTMCHIQLPLHPAELPEGYNTHQLHHGDP